MCFCQILASEEVQSRFTRRLPEFQRKDFELRQNKLVLFFLEYRSICDLIEWFKISEDNFSVG